MNENNEQVPGGYYYAPLQETGSLQDWFESAGKIIGAGMAGGAATVVTDVAGGRLSKGAAASLITAAGEAGSQAGGPYFRAIGFYLDNIDTVLQNLETLVTQLNDYRSWTTPDMSC